MAPFDKTALACQTRTEFIFQKLRCAAAMPATLIARMMGENAARQFAVEPLRMTAA